MFNLIKSSCWTDKKPKKGADHEKNINGKVFAEDSLIVAMGITMGGEKVILGLMQTGTENKKAIADFLRDLLSRGLRVDEGLLVIVDGSKGFLSSVKEVFEKKAVIQRCQWHKRENVISYLPKDEQEFMRKRLQRAYDRPTYAEAKDALLEILKFLGCRNLSAAKSLEEGLEETLTLHRLGVYALVGTSLKTTNCLETINGQIEKYCSRVSYWKNSSQKQRWLTSSLLAIEPGLRRIKGYDHLPMLRDAVQKDIGIQFKERRVA